MRRPFLRRLIQAIVILILIFYAFQKRETLAQIAWVFAAASVLTLVLSPACTLLERKGFRPASASAVCILGLVLLAVLALSAFIPYLFASTADLIRRIIPTLFALTQRSRDILEAFNIRLNAQAHPGRMADRAGLMGNRPCRQKQRHVRRQSGAICFCAGDCVLSALRAAADRPPSAAHAARLVA